MSGVAIKSFYEVYNALPQRMLESVYRAAMVVIELKVAREIHPSHKAQLIHYLVLTQMPVGLIVNFGPTPKFMRVVGPAARGLR